ncbi:MAG: orotidine-5'-phosphate decarboxylase [Actinomycetes bacterium]
MPVDAADVPEAIRSKLALVLDFDDLVPALRMARMLQPYFGVAKVGLELFSAAGPEAIASLNGLGYDVFIDLKLLDIPTTVNKAAKVLGSVGARYLTLHARGDATMLRAGVEGFREGAALAGLPEPFPLAVTVLTSDAGAPPHILPARVALAVETHCAGVVCAAADLREARQIAPRLIKVVPGIRPDGSDLNDQARSATPRHALDNGADLLVIGRPVTASDDPVAAIEAIVAEMS